MKHLKVIGLSLFVYSVFVLISTGMLGATETEKDKKIYLIEKKCFSKLSTIESSHKSFSGDISTKKVHGTCNGLAKDYQILSCTHIDYADSSKKDYYTCSCSHWNGLYWNVRALWNPCVYAL